MNTRLKTYWRREDGWAATTTAIVLGITAAITSAASAVTSGMAQKAAGDFNAKVAENNAKMAQQQAQAEANIVQQRNRKLRGAQVAALSAAGLDVTSDSADSVLYDSAVSGELDRLTTIYRGSVQSTNYESQAAGDRFSGDNAMTAGFITAGGSLLSGGASAASKYADSKRNAPIVSS